MTSGMDQKNLKLDINIPFLSNKEAEIAYDVLRVDKEPPRSQVTKSLNLHKNNLSVSFSAPSGQQLRVGVTSFFENIILLTETIAYFGPPVRH